MLHRVRNRVRALSLSRTDSIHPTNLEAIFVARRAARGAVGQDGKELADRPTDGRTDEESSEGRGRESGTDADGAEEWKEWRGRRERA